MSNSESTFIIPDEIILSKICFIRDSKVMFDSDLAELYGVDTKVLKQQLKGTLTGFLMILCLN